MPASSCPRGCPDGSALVSCFRKKTENFSGWSGDQDLALPLQGMEGGTGSILGWGPKIPQASQRYQKKYPKTLFFLYDLENNTCFYEKCG